ncbi:MAG TPA: exodeoxyribonuclease V subunit alpha [Flavobacteriaceae bacterium]|nr:exodeoxyribonuclease V subunit alpha [Flavobacteriaceae bacterium]
MNLSESVSLAAFSNYWTKRDEQLKLFVEKTFQDLKEGSICFSLPLEVKDPKEEASKKLREADIQASPLLTKDPEIIRPFILYKNNFYIYKYFQYESKVLKRIGEFNRVSQEQAENRRSKVYGEKDFLEDFINAENEKLQFVAAINAFLNQFSIITGGPGTGKTTTVAKLLSMLNHLAENDLKIALAAPTGKAAKRMEESLNSRDEHLKKNLKGDFALPKATTIHRLLKVKYPRMHHFKKNSENPLNYDVVIIDEASMIDVPLFAKLLEAIDPEKTRLILLGDQNQLPSVGAGSMFKDLCESVKPENPIKNALNIFSRDFVACFNAILPTEFYLSDKNSPPKATCELGDNITELMHSFRFSEKSEIGQISQAVLQGETSIVKSFYEANGEKVQLQEEFKSDEKENSDLQEITRKYQAFIEEDDIEKALDKFNDVRVLCATKRGDHGVKRLNEQIEKQLQINPEYKKFYHNRPIMITRNNRELGLYNGDTGMVRKEDNGELKAHFRIGDEIKSFSVGLMNEVETVFAMTIHKSQGSEFKYVYLFLPTQEDSRILTRELIYTGITRGKEQVKIYSPENVITKGIQKTVTRVSGIQERLNENYK